MDKFDFDLPQVFTPAFDITKVPLEAESIAEDLVESARIYQRSLNPDQEVGVMLASFGQTMTINITAIGYKGSKLIRFIGTLASNGTPAELYQHVSQISFLLIALPKVNPEEPKRAIGFLQD
ncbi:MULTISPECIES: DUF6173 family protein [Paenibacillus]|uniref:DUF6173 family protein n=1 Tax=Paenibacillus TaxID=44249 RepID=UPI0009701D1A|nr:DUF6173 family protein [Paenibacillus odorifer]OME02661.1 hypothetical protein BSK54_10420 [Paenibacillus odorifer]OME27156.1 hypothetical protein BSK57_05435 [Paenibacillus odorifer]